MTEMHHNVVSLLMRQKLKTRDFWYSGISHSRRKATMNDEDLKSVLEFLSELNENMAVQPATVNPLPPAPSWTDPTFHGDGFVLLPDDTITHDGVTLYRVVANRSRLGGRVAPGELGGYIESTDNLREDAWVDGTSKVMGGHTVVDGLSLVCENSVVKDRSFVSGEARVINSTITDEGSVRDCAVVRDSRISGYALVCDSAMLDDVDMEENSVVYDNAFVSSTRMRGYAKVTGEAEVVDSGLYNNISVSGKTRMKNNILDS